MKQSLAVKFLILRLPPTTLKQYVQKKITQKKKKN